MNKKNHRENLLMQKINISLCMWWCQTWWWAILNNFLSISTFMVLKDRFIWWFICLMFSHFTYQSSASHPHYFWLFLSHSSLRLFLYSIHSTNEIRILNDKTESRMYGVYEGWEDSNRVLKIVALSSILMKSHSFKFNSTIKSHEALSSIFIKRRRFEFNLNVVALSSILKKLLFKFKSHEKIPL